MALADYQQLVDDMVPDQATTITPEVRDRAIGNALLRYSVDLERVVVEDVTWTALGYDGPMPVDWTDGAYVRQAEHPVGQQPPALIELAVYQGPGGQRLAAVEQLDAGSVVRVTYGAPHLLQETPTAADTIPLKHRLAVAQLAASLLCSQLATRYSGQRETAMGADVTQAETRAREYSSRAKEYRTAYYVGTDQADPFAKQAAAGGSAGTPAAAAVGSWPGRRRGMLTRGTL